jgi:FtsH-binding integral membrane protein
MDNQLQNGIFSDYSLEQSRTHGVSKTFFVNVFLWMFGALSVSAACAYLFANNSELMSYLISTETGRAKLTGLGWLVMFAPIGFVMLMSFGWQRLSAPAMAGFFIAYAAVTGISLSFILLAYTTGSVVTCFLSAAAMFGVMAVMGYTTNKDLTSFGRILIMGLIGIVVASLINFFFHSPAMDYIISLVGVAVFTGLTAYDVQKLKRVSMGLEYEGVGTANVRKLSILGALTLYLDFINLFLMLLRLFGRRK